MFKKNLNASKPSDIIGSTYYQNAPGTSGHTNFKVGSEAAITELLHGIGSTVHIIVTLIVM